MSQALEGIRIIDMTHNQAGPACAQILGFLGADVIKLEEPKGGDVARRNMRDRPDSDSLFFLLFNANKREPDAQSEDRARQGIVPGADRQIGRIARKFRARGARPAGLRL